MSDEKTVEARLLEVAGMGLKAADLVGAVADLITNLKGDGETEIEPLLTGDPVADAAILRAKGVEQVIKERWNIDLEKVAEALYLFLDVGKEVKGLVA
jgi:hypothetical protein